MKKMILLAALAALPLAGCQRSNENGPTEIAGKLFIFNYRLSTAVYEIALRKTGTIPEGSTVTAEYENPAGGPPLVSTIKIFPFWERIPLESPPLRCVMKDKPYRVTITINGPDKAEIQKIETTVISSLDQSILAAKPLVTGPAYDKNPDVYKADGSADYSPDQTCPGAAKAS
ncbi:hypothetical protein [Gellertiella hungarica]|uniref:Lipoprotein n=1 Tax=Gellertiella hungarica TaxID=1572859 RepID=A0A7W6J693_9HYPH|nr:hypothetical protein [Gellertiella hungarica]MBB4065534.1 hypothetical protein [Gellertiella hungarica]